MHAYYVHSQTSDKSGMAREKKVGQIIPCPYNISLTDGKEGNVTEVCMSSQPHHPRPDLHKHALTPKHPYLGAASAHAF